MYQTQREINAYYIMPSLAERALVHFENYIVKKIKINRMEGARFSENIAVQEN